MDESRVTRLSGTVHPLALAKNDKGVVAAEFAVNRLLLTLARPVAREQALQKFLQEAHSPGSAGFHQWLTPEQFGDRFGAAVEDAQVVTAWLQSHGLTVNRVARNRTTVEFSGTAGQVNEALHTEIHRYTVAGKSFYANAQEISVPAAIHERVASFGPLNDYPLESYATPVGAADYSKETHRAKLIDDGGVTPETTLTSGNKPFYGLGPEDFATQYNVAPVYSGGTTGSGQTIGIIGTSNINLALVDAYRKLFNLPADHTQVIVDGSDPGDPLSPNVEAFLDVEVSGSVAPAATVNLYIAGAQPLQGTLQLAALRAVEDNQASVLSISYGNCEELIGTGNQFWNALWEQAAAQGQTVFVSSGDSGPTTCTLTGSNGVGGLAPVSTLSVNGISSTPWNVSVGGTDFYYSDYASGGASAATLWNQANDSSKGSLIAPLPEQPWDNALGLNTTAFNFSSLSVPSAAGGGGVSNCVTVSSSTVQTTDTCVAGYPKPAWQSAPGVPNDAARDLPDVSLFAANGFNRSAWPICANPQDCTVSSTGNYHVYLVGGTSASSPAMAGVMALIDQKYGRQGQANYTLYGLARKDPTIFHDITVGTNDVLCVPGSGAVCATPVPQPPSVFSIDSFGLYAAGPGYDLATGLGSINVGKLFASWNSAPEGASTTTLQVSPTSFVHGATAAVTTTVAAASGTAVPSGNVALTSTTAALRENAPIVLTNATATTSLANLPGGTYSLVAQYGGDASFAPSTSSPVTLTVTPEASATSLKYYYSPAVPPNLNNPPTPSTLPYGSKFYFEATPASLATAFAAGGLATGTMNFTDGSVSATVPLSVTGVATWLPQNLALGAHSITAAYSGDASFSASTSTALSLTVVKGTPALLASQQSRPIFMPSLGESVYAAGADFIVRVFLRGSAYSNPPSGTVTVNLGPMSQTVTLTANEYLNENLSNGFVTFPAVPAGTYTLSTTYSGDGNWNTVTNSSGLSLVFGATGATSSTTALTLSTSSVDSSGIVSATATVTTNAQSPNLARSVNLFANATAFASVTLTPVSNDGVNAVYSGTAAIPASGFPLGTLQVTGIYLGGENDTASTSAAVPLTVTASDFSLSIAASALAVKAGATVTVPVALTSPYTVGVPVTLACASPSAAITCSITPSSSTITGSGTATLTINAFVKSANLDVPARPGSQPGAGETTVAFAMVLLLVLPRRRKSMGGVVLSLLLLAAASGFVACGGSGTKVDNPPPPITPPSNVNAPVGSYSVVVTATSGGITHNAAVSFNTQ